MKTKGFSKDIYIFCIKLLAIVLLPISILAPIIGYSIIYFVSPENDRVFDIVTLLLYIFSAVAFSVGIIILFILVGERFYRLYAKSVIDYDKSIILRKVEIIPDRFAITYIDDDGDEAREEILFSDYKIIVKTRKEFEMPVFVTKNDVIDRVVIPEIEDGELLWTECIVK